MVVHGTLFFTTKLSHTNTTLFTELVGSLEGHKNKMRATRGKHVPRGFKRIISQSRVVLLFVVGWIIVCVVLAHGAHLEQSLDNKHEIETEGKEEEEEGEECISDCERIAKDVLTPPSSSLPDVSQFKVFLEANRNIPLSEFQELYSSEKRMLQEVTFDPLQAKYFDLFMSNNRKPSNDHQVFDNMAYSAAQRDAFKKNGFIVTEAETSMGIAYYKIFNNDLPLASECHLTGEDKSYDSMLEDLEGNAFFYALADILEGMRTALSEAAVNYLNGPLQQSFNDIDFFIAVGANLLNSEQYYRPDSAQGIFQDENVKEMKPTLFNGYDQVENALNACNSKAQLVIFLFGKQRKIDFTLFQPRGHYAKSAQLRQYFRAMSWLGEIDFAIYSEKLDRITTLRQLGAAVVLNVLLKNSGQDQTFRAFMDAIQALVGPSNSLDMHQFDLFLHQLHNPLKYEELNSHEALENIQNEIRKTNLGVKGYNGDGSRRFAFMGKKFALDGWAQFQFVSHDDDPIWWNQARVNRFSTSAVEVAFSVFANNDSTPVIVQRINDHNSKLPFRDGLFYHHHLVAARKVVDSLPAESWSQSIYTKWLYALRKLSVPKSKKFPQAMRTQAYSMKNMNTQLGSWAQLRHDNILYVEQPRRSMADCDYPDGYVEPFVEFWKAMETLCDGVVSVAEKLPLEKIRGDPFKVFTNFKAQVTILRDISVLELKQKPLTSEQTEFLKRVVEKKSFGSGGEVSWLGWYPQLFYGGPADVVNPDLIACDTFTNPPSDINEGCVVHQALGYPRRIIMAVENGKTSTAYAGPVFGFYEFELPGLKRMNDEEWKEQVKRKANPDLPEWTASYIIP